MLHENGRDVTRHHPVATREAGGNDHAADGGVLAVVEIGLRAGLEKMHSLCNFLAPGRCKDCHFIQAPVLFIGHLNLYRGLDNIVEHSTT